MNYKDAYYHMVNSLIKLITYLKAIDSESDTFYVIALLEQIQTEGEKICVSTLVRPHKAPRCGGTLD